MWIDANLIKPNFSGFVVILEHRYPELFCRQTEINCQKFPGKLDCLAFEIVTKAEIAQHFKERVVPGGITDIFQIVVLAACAYAALRACRTRALAMLLAKECFLKLHHAGIGEQ